MSQNGNRDGNGMRRHAGVGIAGLVVQASFQNVLSRLDGHVRMQNELTCVDAQFFFRGKRKGVVRTGGPQDTVDTAAGDPASIATVPIDTVPVDTGAAVDAALLAFADGLFKVFVADRELAADDAPVALADGAQLLFLRLMPLAGG